MLRFFRTVLVCTAFAGMTLAGAGCGGDAAAPNGNPTPTANPNSGTASSIVTQSAGALTFPPVNGYSGAISTPSVSSGAGATATVVVQTNLPSGLPALGGGLVYASVTLSNSVTFNGSPGFSINVPITPSGSYFIAFYDPTKSPAAWQLAALGPATFVGNTLIFAQTSTVTTLSSGVTYWFGLY
jgi:hypothetical protein